MTDVNQPPEVKRGPGRPPLRPDGQRPSLRDRLRGRTRKFGVDSDRHALPDEYKMEGVSFNWKRHTCKGMEDPFYLANMRQQGWEPVDATDMPNLVPEGYTGPIIVDGQVLMARPQELTNQAEQEVAKASRRQIQEREKLIGVAPRGQAPRGEPAISKEWVRPIPAEE